MSNKMDNYCQILGLDPYKESKYTIDVINEKIDKMETKWSNEFRNKQNDTGQRFKYHKMVEMVPEIRRTMSDPLLRKKVFQEGQKDLEGKCQKLKLDCVILADGKYILLPGVIDGFVKRLHWEGIDKKLVMELANVTEGAVPKPVSEKVTNAYTNLSTVDAFTPSEVLNVLINNPDLEIRCNPLTDASSMSQLRAAFDLCEKRVNSVRQDVLPDQDSFITVLRSIKLILDNDGDILNLIEYGRCNKALTPVMEMIEREYTGQQLSRKYIDELLNVYVKGMNMDMCISILESFCQKKKIAANFSKADSTLIRCPSCDNLFSGGQNTLYCPFCGKTFKTVCPKCSTQQQVSNAVCIKCGFNFKEGEIKAQAIAMNFRMNLQKGHVQKAEKDLVQLKELYATFAGLAVMETELQKTQNRLNSNKKMMMDAYSHEKYYYAKGVGDDILESYPEVMNSDIEIKQAYQDILTHVNSAESYCEKAKGIEDKDEMLAMYVNAATACPDYPDAKAVLKEHPPQGPADPTGKVSEGRLIMKFEAPLDNKGVTYVIYREKNSLPNVTEDTRPLAEIPICAYTDKTLEPGVDYFYTVYSKRWGILSRDSVHFGPVLTLSEVDKVTIEQIDGGLRLMYDKPRGATRVRVWRADEGGGNGDGVEIPLNGENVYDDIGLKGGVKYHYLFVAEYETRNKVERSEGSVFTATPVDAPDPVNDMNIIWNKSDGTFTAKWSTKEPVILFRSEKKYTLQGKMVKMSDIRSWMTEIMPVQEYIDGSRFYIPDGTLQYIYPIIPVGNVGIRGNEIMVANLKPFRDVEKVLHNKDCILTMNWPDNAVAAKLVISNSEVKSLDDATAEIMTIRRDQYNEDKLIRIPMGRAVKKCINIYAMYKFGNEILNSRGIVIDAYSVECKKIRYKVNVTKNEVEFELSTDPTVESLPTICAVRVSEGIPLRKEDGETVWMSPGTVNLSNGTCRFSYSYKNDPEIERIRLFFFNEEDYNLFRFVHPLYKNRRD